MIRKITALAFIIALVAGSGFSTAENPAPPRFEGLMGQFIEFRPLEPAPDSTFVDGEEELRSLSDFRGRVVLLNFWATWCAPCIREMPALDRLEARLGGENFIVIAVSLDRLGVAAAKAFYDGLDLNHLGLYADRLNSLYRRLGARGLPTTFLVDRDGNVAGILEGPAEWDSDEAVALILHYVEWGSETTKESNSAFAKDPG